MSVKRAVVVGNVGLETSLKLDTFPLPGVSSYQPGRLELNVSGVGYNVARALQVLGTSVRFASVVGADTVGRFIQAELQQRDFDTPYLHTAVRSGRSLVVSDPTGARHVHTDLGGVAGAVYPPERFDEALEGCALAVLTNIGYSRPLLRRAQTAGVPVSTDLHAIRSLDNPYDRDFLEAATLLFFSGENLTDARRSVTELRGRFDPEVVVASLGAAGALLSERGRETVHVPAFPAPQILSTVGAGDALHAAFCHFWLQGERPEDALRLACAFAARKIAAGTGAQGFVGETEVRRLVGANPPNPLNKGA